MSRSLKEEARWNYVHIRSILQTPVSGLLTGVKLDVRYSVYLVSFSLFVVYFLRYIRHLVARNERRPHPLFVDGKAITESVSCNPDGKEFYSIDKSVCTITDIRKLLCHGLFIVVIFPSSVIEALSFPVESG